MVLKGKNSGRIDTEEWADLTIRLFIEDLKERTRQDAIKECIDRIPEDYTLSFKVIRERLRAMLRERRNEKYGR